MYSPRLARDRGQQLADPDRPSRDRGVCDLRHWRTGGKA